MRHYTFSIGSIDDYHNLSLFHYRQDRPATFARVYVAHYNPPAYLRLPPDLWPPPSSLTQP